MGTAPQMPLASPSRVHRDARVPCDWCHFRLPAAAAGDQRIEQRRPPLCGAATLTLTADSANAKPSSLATPGTDAQPTGQREPTRRKVRVTRKQRAMIRGSYRSFDDKGWTGASFHRVLVMHSAVPVAVWCVVCACELVVGLGGGECYLATSRLSCLSECCIRHTPILG